ncbi:MAG: type II toxin-antitoxin system MqsA family antitoxin [Chloroflexi bacterium]|nr:type II toxin-antitoxin system MqsA family antitoxin [Chloroflexota bacterium]
MRFDPCEYCDGPVVEKSLTEYERSGGRLVVIENVPVGVCQRCGERYYLASVVEAMERIAQMRAEPERTIIVPVRQYQEVPSSAAALRESSATYEVEEQDRADVEEPCVDAGEDG